jgi:hypothetical protein
MKRHRKSVAQKIIDDAKIITQGTIAMAFAMGSTVVLIGFLVYIYSALS